MDEARVQEIREEYPQSGDESSGAGLTNLQAAFRNVLVQEPQADVDPYNRDTCVEFHQLLVSSLHGYLKAQEMFKKKLGMDEGAQVECARKVWNFSYLLWRIAHSQILWDHLAVLNLARRLTLPTFSMAKSYHPSQVDASGKPVIQG
jgi:hypothetical protein